MNAVVTYFIGVSHDEEQFIKIDCVVTPNVKDALLRHEPPQFIEILVNDGESMILRVDNINNIQQII